MPVKKPPRRGPRRSAPRRKPPGTLLRKALTAVAVLAVIVTGVVVATRFLSPPKHLPARAERQQVPQRAEAPALNTPRPEKKVETRPPATQVPARTGGDEKPPRTMPPIHEVVPEKAPLQSAPAESGSVYASLPPTPPELPPVAKPRRVAIIIDDLGYDRHIAEKLMDLHVPLTLAILPHSTHQQAIARMAQSRGFETMLHLPMEPMEYPEINPGPGTLLASMGPDELLRVLEENLNSAPQVKGVNNHMGSKLTTRSEQMYQVFSLLKRRGLFFVDSRTTDESICRPSARLMQIPFAQRDVFLDHLHDPAFIRKQIRELVRIARLKGEAVGIAHPNSMTYAILKEELPSLRQQVDLVPVSSLVRLIE